ncbi:unnamed protein product [Caenorhabditis brenneri]
MDTVLLDHCYSTPESPREREKQPKKRKLPDDSVCQVCGDRADSINCDVPTCFACESFFRRQSVQSSQICRHSGNCVITSITLTACAPCRYKKCLAVGMRTGTITTYMASWMCEVCGDKARNNKLGAWACESCQSFFLRRCANELSSPCEKWNSCEINECDACRYNKCLEVGMTAPPTQLHQEIVIVDPGLYEVPTEKPRVDHCVCCARPSYRFLFHTHYGVPMCKPCKNMISDRLQGRALPQPCLRGDGMCREKYFYKMIKCAACRFKKYQQYLNQEPDPIPPWTPEPCEVCGGSDTGMHYGAVSCGPCAKFFSAITKSRNAFKYKCKKDGNCEMTPETRKNCMACRFSKCVAVGMKGLGVQKTNPKRISPPSSEGSSKTCRKNSGAANKKKNRRGGIQPDEVCSNLDLVPSDNLDPMECPDSSSEPQFALNNNIPDDLDASITKSAEHIIHAHIDNCDSTIEKCKLIIPKPMTACTDVSWINRLNAWQMNSQEIGMDIQKALTFANKLSRLEALDWNDRVLIVKKNYFSMFLLRMAPAISDRGLLLHDGRVVDLKTLELIYGVQLTKKILNFAQEISHLQLTDADIALFITKMLCQFHPDPGYINPSKLLEVCNYYIKVVQESVEVSTYLGFESLAPELNALTESHYEMLNFVRENSKYFMECFDIK